MLPYTVYEAFQQFNCFTAESPTAAPSFPLHTKMRNPTVAPTKQILSTVDIVQVRCMRADIHACDNPQWRIKQESLNLSLTILILLPQTLHVQVNPILLHNPISYDFAGNIRYITGDSALRGLYLRLQEEHHSSYETHHLR